MQKMNHFQLHMNLFKQKNNLQNIITKTFNGGISMTPQCLVGRDAIEIDSQSEAQVTIYSTRTTTTTKHL